jgi:hypothetical protein
MGVSPAVDEAAQNATTFELAFTTSEEM